ncbi:uncharacterized protein G2W53_019580 [Senna tora]|uniref:Uncharacterized protein n=1 Tax=Senna tora TaxID=362788 RepID=A0A834TY34_9FABA|nr:uncharacterized protein G2W53_019580 [Senna tora]
MINDAVATFDADNNLATGSSERIIVDGLDDVGVIARRLGILVGNQGTTGLMEGGEGIEGTGRWKPFSGLEKDIGFVHGLIWETRSMEDWLRLVENENRKPL